MENMETNRLKAYSKPELAEYGSVTTLIRSGSGNFADNGTQCRSQPTVAPQQQTAG